MICTCYNNEALQSAKTLKRATACMRLLTLRKIALRLYGSGIGLCVTVVYVRAYADTADCTCV